ncbi:hypothetical protein JAB5_00840 [Janthinobacterium sp. HH103]|uniref:head-tail connector protein n=1 Tax=unclassified Janthinobacterium TaxID=2610881 RepID=UPI00089310A7|nr:MULTISPECIES: hypothetical protein [unclassified Janthinobacterium]OEZ66302.1 hypothetical protein JAB2_30280 [Janthinobacterium sp. HH100]OEZ89337.1 hypothetical protein JAB5_00840 [Janthinobacterium sp. HH103]
MTKIRTIPPDKLAVPIEQVRANMRIDGDYMDSLLEQWLKGITATAEHEIGQCLMPQTWEVRLDAFPALIDLPHPVLGVSSVKYVDADGAERTLPPAAYKLVPARYKTELAPARGAAWPATSPEPHAVIVTVECGYGDTSDKVPANVQLYLLAKLVDQFDPNTRAEKESAPSPFIERLLDGCRSSV